jgi:hypothetical protein
VAADNILKIDVRSDASDDLASFIEQDMLPVSAAIKPRTPCKHIRISINKGLKGRTVLFIIGR